MLAHCFHALGLFVNLSWSVKIFIELAPERGMKISWIWKKSIFCVFKLVALFCNERDKLLFSKDFIQFFYVYLWSRLWLIRKKYIFFSNDCANVFCFGLANYRFFKVSSGELFFNHLKSISTTNTNYNYIILASTGDFFPGLLVLWW